MQWERVERGATRAMRFPIVVSLRYRPAVDSEWRDGESVNISGTGVLFRAAQRLELQIPVELSFTLPAAVAGGTPVRIDCRGQVVRALAPESPRYGALVAAAIAEYRFVREGGPEHGEAPS